MKRSFRLSFIVIFIALLFGVSVRDASAQNILGEILRRMDVYNKSLQSLQADVTMVKTNAQLNESDTTIGNTSYLPQAGKRPMYVRIDWTKPVQEQISVIGDTYELYRPRLKQVITGKTKQAKNNASVGGALSFMNMKKDELKANYDIQFIAQENIKGDRPTWHLLLTPKSKTSYKTAELWVDGDGMPRQAKVTELNGDTTTILIENPRKNITLNADVFRLEYPKGVKKINA